MLGINKKQKENKPNNAGFPGFTEDNTPDLEVNKETLTEEPTNPLALPTQNNEVPEIKPKQEEQKSESLNTIKPIEKSFLQVISGEILENGKYHYSVISNRPLGINQIIYLA